MTNPQATAETIDADGWLHTGDLGSMDSRGYVKITGRVKEMIMRGGENLFPAEIEAALLEHPAIAEVAVAGVPDEKWGEIVAAFLRLTEGAQRPEDGELRSFIRERLSPQKTPAHWVWVNEFSAHRIRQDPEIRNGRSLCEGAIRLSPPTTHLRTSAETSQSSLST